MAASIESGTTEPPACSAPPANVRHAEKRRSASTCALADNVARSALAEWRALDASKLAGQTCVAAIVAAVGPRCACLALGAGTKVARRSAVAGDARGEVLRDCHAEVLAVRAFRRYVAAALGRGGGDFFERRSDGSFALRAGVAFYLYCSSAPCGNSTIRKWAKTKREVFRDELGDGPPLEPHAPFHVTAPGQVALLGKRRPDDARPEGGDDAPSGCCVLDGDGLRPHCCSDKVARWAALGLEGALLSRFVRIPLGGVVVGRKFSFEHARRAFCCRLPFLERHPALMGTAIPCDEGVYVGGVGADFLGRGCVAWTSGEAPEDLDGAAGVAAGGAPSALCRRAARGRYVALCGALGAAVDAAAPYEALKRAADDGERRAAFAALCAGPRAPFRDWLSSRPVVS